MKIRSIKLIYNLCFHDNKINIYSSFMLVFNLEKNKLSF
jgi:hypothetical protein